VLPASNLCISSAPWQTIWQENMIASAALVIAIQVSWSNVCFIQTKLYSNYVSKELPST
jgi:hypothetical protein